MLELFPVEAFLFFEVILWLLSFFDSLGILNKRTESGVNQSVDKQTAKERLRVIKFLHIVLIWQTHKDLRVVWFPSYGAGVRFN